MSDRVFIDTSALFAAVRSSRGFARDLINAGIDGRAELHVSQVVIDETVRNLAKKGTAAELAFFGNIVSLDVLVLSAPSPLATYDRRHLLSRAKDIHRLFAITVLTPEDILHTLGSNP